MGFIAILMVNFVGTHGAESGGDILRILGLCILGTLLGVGLARLGKRLSGPGVQGRARTGT